MVCDVNYEEATNEINSKSESINFSIKEVGE